MQNYEKIVEPRFPELEHEAKMRLHQTHFHTFERQCNEAGKRKEDLALGGRNESSI